jgi:hypothetical protein
LPLAVSSAVWFSRHRLRRSLFSDQTSPLFEFRLPLESYPAVPSQPAAACQLLSWAFGPYSTSGFEGPLTRVRPPASFRLQGLVTLLAVFSLRGRAGSVSHRQRSWDSPFGALPSRQVSGVLPPECTHLPFRPSVLPPPEGDGPAQTSPGSWVSTLTRVPGGRQGFSSPTAGCSPGVLPSRASRRQPHPSLHPDSSLTLPARTVSRPTSGVPEYRSALAWPHPLAAASDNDG